jgi:hypothetical protein
VTCDDYTMIVLTPLRELHAETVMGRLLKKAGS